MSWIVNPLADLSFMLVGIIIFFINYYSSLFSSISLSIILFFSLVLMDGGHVYLTYLRIVKEWSCLKKTVISLHIFLFLFFFSFQYYKIILLWHLVTYFTIFHFLRQFYGIMRWYLFCQKHFYHKYFLNVFFYLNTLIPLICLHLRIDLSPIGYYAKIDTFFYPSLILFNAFKILNISCIIIWAIYEVIFYIKYKKLEFTRVLYLFTTFLLFNLISFYSTGALSIILPLVACHGLQYYILLSKTLITSHKISAYKVIFSVLLIGTSLGYLSDWVENNYDLTYGYLTQNNYLNITIVSLLLTPLFSHYILDMIIWKKKFLEKF